jgi:hypothetical protein
VRRVKRTAGSVRQTIGTITAARRKRGSPVSMSGGNSRSAERILSGVISILSELLSIYLKPFARSRCRFHGLVSRPLSRPRYLA